MKKSILSIFIIFTGILFLSACASQPAEAITTPVSAESNTLLAEGRLQPNQTMAQTFTISGKISEVLVNEGDQVKKGQPIAQLETSNEAVLAVARAEQEVEAARLALKELQRVADINLAQAKMDLLKTEDLLENAKDTFDEEDTEENEVSYTLALANYQLAKDYLNRLEEGKGIDPEVLSSAETRLHVAELSLMNAQSVIEAHQLLASMDGEIINNDLQVGQLISAGEPLMEIVDFTPWIVETENLTEMDVISIKIGQTAQITFDAYPEKSFNASVSAIASQYEEKRGDITYTVTLELDEAYSNLRWGMTAAVSFDQN